VGLTCGAVLGEVHDMLTDEVRRGLEGVQKFQCTGQLGAAPQELDGLAARGVALVDGETGVLGEQGRLPLGVPAVGVVGIEIDEPADGHPVGDLRKECFGGSRT
jgi:hypothetical protein